MIELELTRLNRLRVARMLSNRQRVDLTIQSVIEGQHGCVFVNDDRDPTVFQIRQGSFCLLAGNAQSKSAKEIVKSLPIKVTIMPSPKEWIDLAQDVHGPKLRKYKRFTFSSKDISDFRLLELIDKSEHKKGICRIERSSAEYIQKDPRQNFHFSNFGSIDDFLERGIGFCYMEDNQVIGAASSSLVCSTGIEVNIMILPENKRDGIGTALSASLVKYCLDNNIEPHWDASNPISCKLANKLGYIRYHRMMHTSWKNSP